MPPSQDKNQASHQTSRSTANGRRANARTNKQKTTVTKKATMQTERHAHVPAGQQQQLRILPGCRAARQVPRTRPDHNLHPVVPWNAMLHMTMVMTMLALIRIVIMMFELECFVSPSSTAQSVAV
jgi:hypothetical protein